MIKDGKKINQSPLLLCTLAVFALAIGTFAVITAFTIALTFAIATTSCCGSILLTTPALCALAICTFAIFAFAFTIPALAIRGVTITLGFLLAAFILGTLATWTSTCPGWASTTSLGSGTLTILLFGGHFFCYNHFDHSFIVWAVWIVRDGVMRR